MTLKNKRYLILILLLFPGSFLAEEPLDFCDEGYLDQFFPQVTTEYLYQEKTLKVFCETKIQNPNNMVLFNDLVNFSKNLRNLTDPELERGTFEYFLIFFPEILFQLYENGEIENIVDTFIIHMDDLEKESFRLDSELYFASLIKELATYQVQYIRDPTIAVDLINYAERVVFNSFKENEIIPNNNLPILLQLKIIKLSALILSGETDEIISESTLFVNSLNPEMYAGKFEIWTISNLLHEIENITAEGSLDLNSIQNLRISLFYLIFNNKELDISEYEYIQDDLFSYVLIESFQEKNKLCDEETFTKLRDDKRIHAITRNFIDTFCFPTKYKTMENVNRIFTKYENDQIYKTNFDNFYKTLINPYGDTYTLLGSLPDDESKQIQSDVTFILSGSDVNIDHQASNDLFLKECRNGSDECKTMMKQVSKMIQSMLVDLPKEININNIGNEGILFRIAEMTLNFEENKKFATDFFKNTEIVFPTNEEIIDCLSKNTSSIENQVRECDAIQKFMNLYHISDSYIFFDDDEQKKEHSKILLEFYTFFARSAGIIYTLSPKDSFFQTIESHYLKDKLLMLLHAAIVAHDKYEYYSGNYDFFSFPASTLEMIMKVKKNDFDKSLSLNRVNINDEMLESGVISKIKKIFASNFRINNYLTLVEDYDQNEIRNLRFEQDSNRNYLNDVLDKFTDQKTIGNDKLIDRIRENLKQNEVLEYHFSIKSSERRIVFRIYGDMVTVRSYELSDTEVLKVYDEFSNFKYINQNRKHANDLSQVIYDLSSLDSIKKVYIISEGILKYIPFHALNYKNKYLSENFEVSYLPSLSSFLNLTSENSPLNFLGVGDPFFDALENEVFKTRNITDLSQLASLPETQEEIIEISTEFDSKMILLGMNATKKNFQSLKNFHSDSLIYFATHSLPYGNSISEEPGLVLTPVNDQESGILKISDISENNFSGSIVALSACKTFDSSHIDKEAYSGIAQAFFLGGAKGVYTTMWEIESLSASKFNSELFRGINNSNITNSLQQVSQAFINGDFGESYKDPFYWAPYIYLGK
ncbi:CHAT domain-containing protein [SAR86 cluster bacterium]|nr:CHAT domain-containing protein [SAR86 cluster bacterium]